MLTPISVLFNSYNNNKYSKIRQRIKCLSSVIYTTEAAVNKLCIVCCFVRFLRRTPERRTARDPIRGSTGISGGAGEEESTAMVRLRIKNE